MASISADIDPSQVLGSDRSSTVICFNHAAVVVVIDAEYAPLGLAGAEGGLLGQCRISHGSLDPSPAIHLEDAAVGHGAEGGKVPRAIGIVILGAIEAALHVGEPESANKTLRDAIPPDDSQRFVLGRDFAAI